MTKAAIVTRNAKYRSMVLRNVWASQYRSGLARAVSRWRYVCGLYPGRLYRRATTVQRLCEKIEQKSLKISFSRWHDAISKSKMAVSRKVRYLFNSWRKHVDRCRPRSWQLQRIILRSRIYPVRRAFQWWFRMIVQRTRSSHAMRLVFVAVDRLYMRRIRRAWSSWWQVIYFLQTHSLALLSHEARQLSEDRFDLTNHAKLAESREVELNHRHASTKTKLASTELLVRRLAGQVARLLTSRQKSRIKEQVVREWKAAVTSRKLAGERLITTVVCQLGKHLKSLMIKSYHKWGMFVVSHRALDDKCIQEIERRHRLLVRRVYFAWKIWAKTKTAKKLELRSLERELESHEHQKVALFNKQRSTGREVQHACLYCRPLIALSYC